MGYGERTSHEVERVASIVVDAAYKVHRVLGPGLLESVYEACLAFELSRRGLTVQRQVILPIIYEGMRVDNAFRVDLFVNRCVIIEVKAVEKLIPIFESQVQTYLKLTGLNLGFLINFNVALLKDGLKRILFTPPAPHDDLPDLY